MLFFLLFWAKMSEIWPFSHIPDLLVKWCACKNKNCLNLAHFSLKWKTKLFEDHIERFLWSSGYGSSTSCFVHRLVGLSVRWNLWKFSKYLEIGFVNSKCLNQDFVAAIFAIFTIFFAIFDHLIFWNFDLQQIR